MLVTSFHHRQSGSNARTCSCNSWQWLASDGFLLSAFAGKGLADCAVSHLQGGLGVDRECSGRLSAHVLEQDTLLMLLPVGWLSAPATHAVSPSAMIWMKHTFLHTRSNSVRKSGEPLRARGCTNTNLSAICTGVNLWHRGVGGHLTWPVKHCPC